MSYQEYVAQLAVYSQTYPEQREGQRMFNALHSYNPDLANSIRGGPLDPFNCDHMPKGEDIKRAFMEYVREHLDDV